MVVTTDVLAHHSGQVEIVQKVSLNRNLFNQLSNYSFLRIYIMNLLFIVLEIIIVMIYSIIHLRKNLALNAMKDKLLNNYIFLLLNIVFSHCEDLFYFCLIISGNNPNIPSTKHRLI